MKSLFIISLVAFSILNAQTDWEKWEAKEISYKISDSKLVSKSDLSKYRQASSNFRNKLINAAKSIYKFFISDLDGDNCPFYPSCSEFFVQAVKETNILKGTLMFVDRFTRDMNFFKGTNHYPHYINGKYYDPAINYALIPQKINYVPEDVIVK